jgi:hypothetical protein
MTVKNLFLSLPSSSLVMPWPCKLLLAEIGYAKLELAEPVRNEKEPQSSHHE